MPLRGPDPEHVLVSIEEAVRVLAELIETSPVMSVRSVADHLGAWGALLPNDAVPHDLRADLVRCNVVRRLFEFIDVGPWSCRSLQAFFKISSHTGAVCTPRRPPGATTVVHDDDTMLLLRVPQCAARGAVRARCGGYEKT